ncbi:hypothetical protein G5I_04660 [Acromyrmex echinatior]|uniref:Uncharacterized protein n=1 Tax=Acromyrmex echinatior TaxID=103372 RepID=F4WG86_ACREC|nr:hypothetical protein G5I_04660 [Acromyrmex echinatior]
MGRARFDREEMLAKPEEETTIKRERLKEIESKTKIAISFRLRKRNNAIFVGQRERPGARELAPPRRATALARLGGRDRAPPSSPDLGGGPVVAMCCGLP